MALEQGGFKIAEVTVEEIEKGFSKPTSGGGAGQAHKNFQEQVNQQINQSFDNVGVVPPNAQ